MERKLTLYLVYSLLFLGISLGIVWLYINRSQELIKMGIDQNLFYIALIPLGFSTASFLFGAMRSHAHFSGRQFNGTLQLGGPVVVFMLTVLGGFFLVKNMGSFDYLLLVTGKKDQPLEGDFYSLRLLVGAEVKTVKVEHANARFFGIPYAYRSQTADLYLDAPGWMFENGSNKMEISFVGQSQQIKIVRDTCLQEVYGSVQ